MRFGLFEATVAPASSICFSPMQAGTDLAYASDCCIVYHTAKPTGSPEEEWRIPIHSQDVQRIPQRLVVDDDVVFETSMWGGPRDYSIIRHLGEGPSIRDLAMERGWVLGTGYTQAGNKANEAPEYVGVPLVSPDSLCPFRVNEQSLPLNTERFFYRPVKKLRDIYRGPHMLIKKAPEFPRGLIAAVLMSDALFSKGFLGVRVPDCDVEMLNAICLIANSSLATYHGMMTSRAWLVERSELESGELETIPLPAIIRDLRVTNEHLDKLAADRMSISAVDALVFDWFGLSNVESQLITDTVRNEWEYYLASIRPPSKRRRRYAYTILSRASSSDVERYVMTLHNAMESSFGRRFFCNVLYDQPDLIAVAMTLGERGSPVQDSPVMSNRPRGIADLLMPEGDNEPLPYRKVILFEDDSIFIVKPGIRYYWTYRQALQDANKLYVEIMNIGTR